MGRHSDESAEGLAPGRSGLTVVSIIAIIAVLLIVFALRDFLAPDPDNVGSSATGENVSSNNDQSEESAPSDVPDMGEQAAETSMVLEDGTIAESTTEPTTVEPTNSEEPLALIRCRAEVAAGDEWATATASSASNWKQHYKASARYNAGDITLREAEAIFVSSKARGAADTQAVNASTNTYVTKEGACASMSPDELPDDFVETAQVCRTRAEVIGDVIPVGTEVNNDWAAHLTMMKSKDTTDPAEYYDRWREMVAMAPSDMKPYEAAVDSLDKAPGCPSV